MMKHWTGVVALAVLATACGGGNQGAAGTVVAPPASQEQQTSLAAIIDGDWRSPENRARDAFRHPQETLEFFGIQPGMTVIEIWPGAGWYTEILAPYLQTQGRYIAAHWDPDAAREGTREAVQAFKDKLAARPDLYGGAEVTVLAPPDNTAMAEPESVDMVLTFRNIHNWMMAGQEEAMFAAMYRVLKPGGVLGVVEHRAPADQPVDARGRSGYVGEAHAVALAEQAGFLLEAASEVNANPLDTKDHPAGVWTLPPTFAKGDENREHYAAIGESDRFTLRFRKPAAGVDGGS